SIRWITYEQMRPGAREQPLDIGCNCRIAAQQAMFAEKPEIAGASDWIGRRLGGPILFRRFTGAVLIETGQQLVELVLAKAQKFKTDTILLEPFKLSGEE